MKSVLGLDLGSTSIGWAYILEDKNKVEIKKLGVRVIPYLGDENDKFSKGQAISVNKDRTTKRTARKMIDRYKQRRQRLIYLLELHQMLPNDRLIKNLSGQQLYGLRSNAFSKKLELVEIGRILLHLNQKRGYKSSRMSNEEDAGNKLSDYLTAIQSRKSYLSENNLTIGQFFYKCLLDDSHFKIKGNVFPRECYVDEFNKIWDAQAKYYPEILSEKLKIEIRDQILFYQRRLKSQKHLVGQCTFELNHKVTPKSSPLFQLEKVWESIHNISLTNKENETYIISAEQKEKIFQYLDINEKLTKTELLKILGLKRTAGWHANEQISKAGIQGNLTKSILLKEFKKLNIKRDDLLQFNLETKNAQTINKGTGELIDYEIITEDFEKEPLYQLWHILYSIEDPENVVQLLDSKYGFSREDAVEIAKIDFKRLGFGNKSARCIRKLLPALMNNMNYTSACQSVGYRHSFSITKEENLERELVTELPLIAKNSLRQPVVEKIMNQLIHVVNHILKDESLGRPDEIRIELARELRQNREERNEAYMRNIKTEKDHKQIIARISAEYPGIKVTRKVIEKYKLFEQQEGICIYSGKAMELGRVLRGDGYDVDHIIPQSKLFDDSFQNKVLAIRAENEKKDNATALDYMKSKSEEQYKQYLERIYYLFENGRITKSKHIKLQTSEREIPDDFINRQLNETRFITKEAVKLLSAICHNVFCSSGAVTEFLRNHWGYNEVLKQINWHKYDAAGRTIGDKIDGWSKREDHRHHAIDAFVVACTKQRLIQQLNTLNSAITRADMLQFIDGKTEVGWQARKSLLEQYIQKAQPVTTGDLMNAVKEVLISIKQGKKVASKSKNKANGQVTISPRGQLHKEQVYGKIKRYGANKVSLNSKFNLVDLIINPNEKKLVLDRLAAYSNDPKLAFKDLKKNPIWINEGQNEALTEVRLWEEYFVYKYTLDQNFKEADINSIIDDGIREKVRARFNEKEGSKDHPLKNIEQEPIWLNKEKGLQIKSVRCFTGLNSLVPLHSATNGVTNNKKSLRDGKPIDYVNPRNNHHLAVYEKPDGQLAALGVSFWEAVERKRFGLPVIVKEPLGFWDDIMNKEFVDDSLLENIPKPDWKFFISLEQNEYIVFDLGLDKLKELISKNQTSMISERLYRVQKLSKKSDGSVALFFRHHLETSVDDKKNGGEVISKKLNKVIIISSLDSLKSREPVKVRVNYLGKIECTI